MTQPIQLSDAQLAAIMAQGDPTVTAQLVTTIQAASQAPAGQRRDPTAAEALKAVADGIEAVLATGRAFTAHSVTVKARELNPTLDLSHDKLRGTIKATLANYANVAVTRGAQRDGGEFDLYTPLA